MANQCLETRAEILVNCLECGRQLTIPENIYKEVSQKGFESKFRNTQHNGFYISPYGRFYCNESCLADFTSD